MAGNNTMVNETSQLPGCDEDSLSAAEKSWKMFAFCFIAVGSLVGNSLVSLVIFKNRNMRTTINYFIVNMAVSDILFTIFVIPRQISELYSAPGRWFVGGTLGALLCKFDFFVQDVSTAVSILSLVAIAIDRFYGVAFPMKAGLMNGGKVCGSVLAGTWLLGALFHAPYFYPYKLAGADDLYYCVYNWGPNIDQIKATKAYFLVMSIALFFLPVAFLTIFYSIIIITLKRQQFPGNQSLKDKQRVAKRNRNVLKMVVAVVIVFISCWLPFNVSVYVLLFHWEQNVPCYARTLLFWVLFLAESNCYINPCLYFIFSENFRQGFRKVFCARKHRESIRSQVTVQRSTRHRTAKMSLSIIDSMRTNNKCPSNMDAPGRDRPRRK